MSDKHLSAEELIAQDSGARLPDGIMAQIHRQPCFTLVTVSAVDCFTFAVYLSHRCV